MKHESKEKEKKEVGGIKSAGRRGGGRIREERCYKRERERKKGLKDDGHMQRE